MDSKVLKTVALSLGLIIFVLIVKYTINIFLIVFASILFAMLLNSLGNITRSVTRLPYYLSLALAVVCIIGLLTLTFWLYSPLITEQTNLLRDQLPQAITNLRGFLTPYMGLDFLSANKILSELSLTNEKLLNNLITVFSFTIGSIVSFLIFLIIGFYFALSPRRYVSWILNFFTPKKRAYVGEAVEQIGQKLRWWLLGKLLSMAVIGILAFIGLWSLNISLAFILGLLTALLAFIPYVGAILAAVPAILIAFGNSPLEALYVTILYVVIHNIEGYLITPYIEQKTVSIPPALTIISQMMLLTLLGPVGLALATPLTVVAISLAHYSQNRKEPRLT